MKVRDTYRSKIGEKMKKITLLLVIIIVVILDSGCTRDRDITIGVVGSMTGNQSDLSVSGRRGIEIAVDEINTSGGINGMKLKLVMKDDKNDPERAKEIVDEFVKEGIHLVIGHYTSGMMLAAYDEMVNKNILYLGPTISADNLSGIDDNFIRFIASTKEQAMIINQEAEKLNQKKFLVLADQKNLGFNEMLYKNFASILTENDGQIIDSIEYESLEDKTLGDILGSTENHSDLDGIFVISNATDLAIITQTIRKNHINVDIYGPLWAHTNDLIRVAGEYAEGIRVVSGIDYESQSDRYMQFNNKFYEMYGQETTFSSIYSYETMMALSQAMKQTGNDDPVEVKNTILSLGQFEGLQATFTIDKYGDNTREYMLDQVIGNTYMRVDSNEKE